MSTLTAPAPEPVTLDQTRRVRLSRLIRVELRKVTDTRAGMWLLVAIGAVTLTAIAIYLFAADADDLTHENLAGITATPQTFLLPVLGILAITSEWSQRTGLVTFTLEPSRSRVVLAKFTAVVGIGLAAVALAIGLGALFNMIGAGALDGAGDWDMGFDGLRDFTLIQLMVVIQGMAFGMILMNSAAAIVLYFVVPNAFAILFELVGALEDVANWVDLSTAQQPLFEENHTVTGTEWSQLFVTSLIWIVLPLVAGLIRLLRSELKSA
jgi:ABC-2 type transport system permease protein